MSTAPLPRPTPGRTPGRPTTLSRLARAAVPVAAALALSGCAGLQFEWANTGSVSKLERRMIDLYDPLSPINVWTVY